MGYYKTYINAGEVREEIFKLLVILLPRSIIKIKTVDLHLKETKCKMRV